MILQYAGSAADLAANPSKAQASCRATNSGDIIRCTAILPHAVHPKPNILTIDEILGLEPPAVRPTRFDLARNSSLVLNRHQSAYPRREFARLLQVDETGRG